MPRDVSERERLLAEALSQPGWIIEGVYYKWLEKSFAAADLIVILETPSWIRNVRIIRRFILRKLGLKRTKKENLRDLWNLLTWGQKYQKEKLPAVKAMTEVCAHKRKIFTSSAAAYDFFARQKTV